MVVVIALVSSLCLPGFHLLTEGEDEVGEGEDNEKETVSNTYILHYYTPSTSIYTLCIYIYTNITFMSSLCATI